MFKTSILSFTFILFSVISLYGAEDASNLKQICESTPRKGLSNFFSKANAGKPVTVCYLGGSITAQGGWRVQSMDYFRKHFPKADFKENNAAIGGTGSQLGVLRMDKEVLKVKPDLLFVEFAVNDDLTRNDTIIYQSMEGIVRKTWKLYPDCDICFVYTVTDRILDRIPPGYFNRAATVMEQIADFYGIPSIFLPTDVLSLLKDGKLVMKTPNGVMAAVAGNTLDVKSDNLAEADGKIYFSPDGTHPYLNTGHKLYTQVIVRNFEKMEKLKIAPFKHLLGKPLNADNFENSRSLSLDTLPKQGYWKLADMSNPNLKKFSDRFEKPWSAMPGATIDFTFKGSGLFCYDIFGPESVILEVTIDGRTRKLTRFDGYCSFWRINGIVLASGLDKNMLHHTTIKVSDEIPDKRKLLFERSVADFDQHPEKYKPNVWYVNSFFLF